MISHGRYRAMSPPLAFRDLDGKQDYPCKVGQVVYKLPAISNNSQGGISPDIKRASSDKDGEIAGLD